MLSLVLILGEDASTLCLLQLKQKTFCFKKMTDVTTVTSSCTQPLQYLVIQKQPTTGNLLIAYLILSVVNFVVQCLLLAYKPIKMRHFCIEEYGILDNPGYHCLYPIG